MADVQIKGGAELQRLLGQLPARAEALISRGALREGARVIEQEAKARVPFKEGKLRDSIRVRSGVKKGGRIYAHILAGGRKKGEAFYARFVEFGTAAHEIRPKGFKSLFVAGLFRKVVQHPGAKPRPFMQPAADAKAGAAVEAIAQFLRRRLARALKAK